MMQKIDPVTLAINESESKSFYDVAGDRSGGKISANGRPRAKCWYTAAAFSNCRRAVFSQHGGTDLSANLWRPAITSSRKLNSWCAYGRVETVNAGADRSGQIGTK